MSRGEMMSFTKLTRVTGQSLARICDWNGRYITKVYLEALTDANFHELRKKVAKLVNKELHTKLKPTD